MKISLAGHAGAVSEGAKISLDNRPAPGSHAPLVMTRDTKEQTLGSKEFSAQFHTPAKLQSLRVAIKVSGTILFISLGEVVSVQADGRCVWLKRNGNLYRLRESITVVADRLEKYGFIRIHRSMLVNTSFVQGIRPLPTGEYRRLGEVENFGNRPIVTALETATQGVVERKTTIPILSKNRWRKGIYGNAHLQKES